MSTRKFCIARRASGNIVAEGLIEGNDVSLLDEHGLAPECDLVAQIRMDIQRGLSGGVLWDGLEWFELMTHQTQPAEGPTIC